MKFFNVILRELVINVENLEDLFDFGFFEWRTTFNYLRQRKKVKYYKTILAKKSLEKTLASFGVDLSKTHAYKLTKISEIVLNFDKNLKKKAEIKVLRVTNLINLKLKESVEYYNRTEISPCISLIFLT